MSDPFVSPADTIRRGYPPPVCPLCQVPWGEYGCTHTNPGEHLADALKLLRELAGSPPGHLAAFSMDQALALLGERDELLAVGERDKAEIERAESLAAAHEGRGQSLALDFERLEDAGERDRRQIAQLTEALEPFAAFGRMAVAWEDGGGWRWAAVPGEQLQRIPVWFGPSDFGCARAVLADEEDAPSSEPVADATKNDLGRESAQVGTGSDSSIRAAGEEDANG